VLIFFITINGWNIDSNAIVNDFQQNGIIKNKIINACSICIGTSIISISNIQKSNADDNNFDFLLNRVKSLDNTIYSPGIKSDDVYYPSWYIL
jgi:hypothetical protein